MKRFSLLTILAVLALLVCCILPTHAEAATSGYYTYSVSGGKATITSCSTSISGNVTIPSTLGGYPVTSIGSKAFSDCSSLTSITIPNSVTSIGNSAFSGCSSLESMTIPFVGGSKKTASDTYQYPFGYIFGTSSYTGGVKITQSYHGSSTSSTTSSTYYIPSSLKSVIVIGGNILSGAFYNCSSLTSITIPGSVTSIGNYAFKGCSSLTGITIPDGVTDIGREAFYGCRSLTSITIPDSVISLGNGAFYYCDSLTSISIPDNVTGIGDDVFYNCSSLTSVTIGDSVTSIGDDAFRYCSSLASITIPNSVTSIGGDAFRGCSSLESMTIPFVGDSRNTASDTYQYPFGYIFGISSYTGGVATKQYYYGSSTSGTTYNTYYIPGSLKSVTVTGGEILYGAFYGCSSLTSVTIGNSVTSIGDDSFRGCSSLTGITIPDSVTSIGNYAFKGCSSLTGINIPDGVTDIGREAFYGCSSLTSVTIGNSVTSIGDDSFSGCSSLESMTIPFVGGSKKTASDTYQYPFGYIFGTSSYTGGVAIRQYYHGPSTSSTIYGTYYIPSSLSSVTVTGGEILCGAFYGCSSLTGISIPDSVTSIGEDAFYYCGNLTSITIPDSVTSIGSGAFSGCSRLTGLTIPDSVTSIGSGAFSRCTSLTSITIPDSVTDIGDSAFFECSSLISISIPDGVTSIGDYAFYKCSSLTSVTIGDSVTSIGYEAFRDCDSLTSLTIPDSVTSIGNSAFYKCRSLISITISDSVTSIGDDAFRYCSSLTSITIPDSVTSIGSWAFSNCTSLTGIWVDTDNENYCSDSHGVLFNKDKTELIQAPAGGVSGAYTIPDGVTSIGNWAFRYCSHLTSVSIGDSVTSIGNYAFQDCSSLTSITIPDSVTSIGERAFYNCNRLNHVAYTGTENQWNSISIKSYNSPLTNATCHYETALQTIENCVAINIYCPVCQRNLTSIAKQNGFHVFRPATCAAPKTCTVCGAVEGDPLGHSYKAATCTAPKTCTVCGAVEGDPLGHSGDIWFELIPHTCTEAGIEARICNICGVTETRELPASHRYRSVVTAPGCTEKGYTTNTCTVCGDVTVTDYVEPAGHSYKGVVTAPTCTERGYTTNTCTVCGDVTVTDYVAAKGHSWSAWITTVKPTCSMAGVQVRFCNCGIRETEELPKLPHSFEDDICTVCGQKSVDLKIASVTLRPEAAGLYFTGSFEIAENVAVVRQGIVVSVYSSMPVADGSDPNSLWSAGTTSVMVKNILRANLKDTSNQNRAAMPIYARAYVELEDGTYIYSDVSAVNLQEVVEAADGQWNTLDAIQKEAFLAMYKKFQAILQAWNIPNVKKV